MKTIIKEVNYIPLTLPLTEPFGIATGAQASADNVLVKIKLANGIIGIGEAAPFTAVSGETQTSTLNAIKKLETFVVGKDVRNLKRIAGLLKEIDIIPKIYRYRTSNTFVIYISRFYINKFTNGISPYSIKLQKLVLGSRRDSDYTKIVRMATNT